MPRQIDLFPQNLQVNHDPTQQLGLTTGQLDGLQNEIPAALEKATTVFFNSILEAIDQATGLDLVDWSKQLQALFSGNTNWLEVFTQSAQTAFTNWDTLFTELGFTTSTAEELASWLTGVNQTANSSQTLATTAIVTSTQGLGYWTGLLAALEQGNVAELSAWLTTAFTNAETAINQWIAVLEAQELADIEAFITWINGFIDNPTFDALLTALFGSSAVGFITTVEQDIINVATNALSGGNAPVSANSPAASLSGVLGPSGIPHTNVAIPPNPGAGTITWDANYFATPFTGPVTSLYTVYYNHTCAADANYLILRLGFRSIYAPIVGVTYNGQAMQLLASDTASSDVNTYGRIYGMLNPPTGTHQVAVGFYTPSGSAIESIVVESDSYIGVGSVGAVTTAGGGDNNPSMIVSAPGDYIVQMFVNSDTLNAALTSYNQTLQYNSGSVTPSTGPQICLLAGDAAGGSSVTFTATAAESSINHYLGAAVNLIPLPGTVIGSVFRAANTSTSTVSASSGNNYFPNGFFNSTTGQPTSDDLTYTPTPVNTVTVTYAGTYSVTIAVLLVSTFTNQFLGLNLVQTPNMGSPTIKRGDTPLISNPSFNTNVVSSHTFQVYCNAGDTLQPGYYCSTSGSAFTGTTDGLSTYFEVSLNNRGVHS